MTKTPCHIVHLGKVLLNVYQVGSKEYFLLPRKTLPKYFLNDIGSGNSVRALEEAQKEGLPITAETCHHYLNLWAEIIPDASAEFKCCPPVRDHW